jgi:hypothetical protein
MQDVDHTLKEFHQLAVASSQFTEGPYLILKNGSDGLCRVAIFEISGEWVFNQFDPGLYLVLAHGGLEK